MSHYPHTGSAHGGSRHYRPDESLADRRGQQSAWSPREVPSGPRSAQQSPHSTRRTNHDQHSGMIPIKRKLSNSPEGSSHQRKAPRNDPFSTVNDSRKNSNANASHIDASADPRQNRGALSNVVRSPISTDGSYQDATSSRSTPRPTNLKVSSAIASSQDERDGEEADDAAMKPLIGSLSTLLSLVRAESGYQVSQKLARIQLETATSEHQNMKSMFPKFPSIEERLKKAKLTADEEVKKLEKQMKINTDAQPGLAKSLAVAFLNISSRAEGVRRAPEVSPENFKDLEDRLTKQQEMLEKQQDWLTKQQDLCDTQQQRIDALQNSHALASKAALQATEQANTTVREICKDVTELENRLQTFQTQLDNSAQNADRARLAIEGHETAVTEITEKLNVQSKMINQLSITLDAATNTVSGAQKGLEKSEERVTATKNDIARIGASEQRAVAKRLDEYDQKLVDLRVLVESLRSENTGIQKDYENLTMDVQKIKDAPKPVTLAHASGKSTSPSIAVDFVAQVEEQLTAFEAKLDKLRNDTKDDADARDEVLGVGLDAYEADLAHAKEQLTSLAQKSERFEELASTCSSGMQRLEQTTNERYTQTGVAYESMRDTLKAVRSNVEMLQAKTTSLSDNVAVLKKRPVQLPAAQPQMPAPATTDAAAFRPIASPRAQNSSIPGNAQTNRVHSPRVPTSPFGLPNGGVPQPREIDVLTNQLRGLSGTVQSLRQRMDNLTTDEVYRGMVDQFSKMYPDAKGFQAAVGALHAVDAKLECRLESIESKVNTIHGNQAGLRSKFDELADKVVEVQQRTSKVNEAVTVFRKAVEVTLRDARKDLDASIALNQDAIIDVRHQVKAIEDSAFGPPDA